MACRGRNGIPAILNVPNVTKTRSRVNARAPPDQKHTHKATTSEFQDSDTNNTSKCGNNDISIQRTEDGIHHPIRVCEHLQLNQSKHNILLHTLRPHLRRPRRRRNMCMQNAHRILSVLEPNTDIDTHEKRLHPIPGTARSRLHRPLLRKRQTRTKQL